jgi:hypothetical protein
MAQGPNTDSYWFVTEHLEEKAIWPYKKQAFFWQQREEEQVKIGELGAESMMKG